jgi:hypothetical protein
VRETNLRFATRLNSFGSRPDAYWPKGHGKPSPLELAERASKAEGLTDVDLNYPDHVGSILIRPANRYATSAWP